MAENNKMKIDRAFYEFEAVKDERNRILRIIEEEIENYTNVNNSEDNYDAGAVHALYNLTEKIKGE